MLDALYRLQIKKYMATDAQDKKNPHIYAQATFPYMRVIKMTSMYNQLIMT